MIKTIKVLHVSTHNEECGIAIYQQNIVDAMGDKAGIENEFFDISPNKLKQMGGLELNDALVRLFEQLEHFDILHIQHEYSFYRDQQLERIIDGAKAMSKKVLVTLHTPPTAHRRGLPFKAPRSLRPRGILHALRFERERRRFIATYIAPLNKADLLIATSKAALESFVQYGVNPSLLKVIDLPVPAVDKKVTTTEIAEKLKKKSDDVILSMTGFLTENKGTIAALKALRFLPSHYKLAIVGGAHPSGQNDSFYEQVCDTVINFGLEDRVYITGYIADDERRDALLRETDVCLYPYDRTYYDYVSSAALTNAIANNLPIVAYNTKTFQEANGSVPFINFTKAAVYYELARTISQIDIKESVSLSREYAAKYSVKNQAAKFAELYLSLS